MSTTQHFTHLHVHTDASLRDGMGTPRSLLERAKGMGFRAVAMTDHGTLANAVTFTIEARSLGLKPIMGMEGYIAFDGELGHITLLAHGDRGWHSLVQLNNIAQRSHHRSPAFTVDELTSHADGLICLTGCVSSPFQRLSLKDAYRLGIRLKGAFRDRLFAELMFVGDTVAWERPIRLAEMLGIRRVITNDVHFPTRDVAHVHPVLTLMKSGFSYDSQELYLKSADEIKRAALRHGLLDTDVREMMDRTYDISRIIRAVDLAASPALPWLGKGGSLRDLVWSLPTRCRSRDREAYVDRLEYELRVIEAMGYEDYFLILEDIVSWARSQGIRVGPGRGSGASSLVLYAMRVTDVNPLEHGLQFERFLNPMRTGMPDVDIDFDSERRDEVLEYAHRKYGAIPIATYARYSHKSLTRDLGRYYKIDQAVVDRAADEGPNGDTFTAIALAEPEFATAYEAFVGQIRHKGKHAGGIIITDVDVPLERVGDVVAAGWSEGGRNELSYAGIVKFDLLGLTVLSALNRLERLTGHKPVPPHLDSRPMELFKGGHLAGVFQFAGSDGIRNLTMDLKPTTLDDLTAINALYRPGAIDAGSMEKFVDWRRGKDREPIPHHVQDVLEDTYGAIVYQEQMMEIYRRTVDGTMAEADDARRLITKPKPDDPRWVEKFAALRDKFIHGATTRWMMSDEDAASLWHKIETHTRYSFNKSHATAYAMIAWECAWYKYYHPHHFYATMLNVDPGNQQDYIMEAIRWAGIVIEPPHVNQSGLEWTGNVEANALYMPLSSIKYMGTTGARAIVDERERAGPYESANDFMERVPKRLVRSRAREGLLMTYGFTGLIADMSPVEKGYEILELTSEPTDTKWTKRQLKYLGFIIPNRRLIEQFETHTALGYTCGIVASSEKRVSKYGEYRVYRLSPNGTFWSRRWMDIEDGEAIGVIISDKNGKAKDLVRL